MTAYFISDASVRNPDVLQLFRERAASSIAHYGGRYIAREESVETIEGSWTPKVVIIIEFPNLERARTWYRSKEYATALAVRDDAISRHMILVDGLV